MKRLTICPHGSFLFLTSSWYPLDSRAAVAFSTLSTSNSSHACGAATSAGQDSLPKQDCAAWGRVAGEQAEVGVEPGRLRVVVAGADVGVAAQAVVVLAHHQRGLAMRLEADHAV